MASDAKKMEANLAVLRRRMAEAYAQLRSNVQKRWGQNDAKVADRRFMSNTPRATRAGWSPTSTWIVTVETLDGKTPKAV